MGRWGEDGLNRLPAACGGTFRMLAGTGEWKKTCQSAQMGAKIENIQRKKPGRIADYERGIGSGL